MDYEAQKLEDQDTGQRCQDQGFQLVPMVVETLGGWGPSAPDVFQSVAKASAEFSGIDISTATCQLHQALAIKLQRDNTALATTSRSEAALVLSAAAATSG